MNDGEELEYSLQKMSEYAPVLQERICCSGRVDEVPQRTLSTGTFYKEDAKAVLEQIHRWRRRSCMRDMVIHFIHALMNGIFWRGGTPEEDRYGDGYLRLGKRCGMPRLLGTEVRQAVAERDGDDRKLSVTVATGRLAAPYIAGCMDVIRENIRTSHQR